MRQGIEERKKKSSKKKNDERERDRELPPPPYLQKKEKAAGGLYWMDGGEGRGGCEGKKRGAIGGELKRGFERAWSW